MSAITHGGELARIKQRFADVPEPWLDLSTGLNPRPWTWSDKISVADIQIASTALPDHDLFAFCKDAWTDYLEAQSAEDWSLAAGTQAVINLLPRLFHDHDVCLPDPTYGEHIRVWQKAGRTITRINAHELLQYSYPDRQVLVVTNPNNPDGFLFDPEGLLALAARLQSQDSFLVVDEAFCDSVPEHSLASRDLPANMIVLRSLGKFFGLAGLRIGCFRATSALQADLLDMLGPWPVNGPALMIAGHALRDADWIGDTRPRLKRDGARLRETLLKSGLEPVGATDLFCLVRSDQTADIARHLAQQGIYVRCFVEDDRLIRFGLPASDEQFKRLEIALEI
jgi:L-threonine-O-3-phosphate decarboxylase